MIFNIITPGVNEQQNSFFMAIMRISGFLPCIRTAEQNIQTGQCIFTIDAPEQLHQDGIKRIAATAFPDHKIVSI